MAQLFPSFEIINNLKVKPTEGESHLLNFLNQNLDNNYEIYFQPWINGDNPDIVIMRKNSGVMIIEVKDWNLNYYHLNEKKNWVLNSNGAILKSPLSQVLKYKNNLYELHIDDLYRKYINDKSIFAFVSLGVYFHCSNSVEINNLLRKGYERDLKYVKWLDFFELMGNDSLSKINIDNMVQRKWLNRKSKYFDDDLYYSFKRYLQPTEHTKEQGKQIEYNKEQQDLINSNAKEQKIKGIAGSGKTMVLAKKAVSFHKATSDKVLVLSYNIALINYLRDKISEVRENFDWREFHIQNYHDFISQQMNNYNIVMNIPVDFDNWEKDKRDEFFNLYYSNINIFEIAAKKIEKYNAILIDETQDFPIEWLTIIKKYFLNENGYYILFADEKQNVYNNVLETDKSDDNDRKTKTNVKGRWNESLKKSYRLSKKISNLANKFQNDIFKTKYYHDNIEIQQPSLFGSETIKYYKLDQNTTENYITNLILSEIKNLNVHSNDVCILSFKIDEIVGIDYELRSKSREKTETTVETHEEKEIIEIQIKEEIKKELLKKTPEISSDDLYRAIENESRKKIERELEKVRKYKRFQFRMNRGFMKLSTIHSFKGWEINTLFLIIERESLFLTEELIYTGLTRCRNNLIILNLGNKIYDDFFGKINF